jgi:hypothetical protein
VIATYRESDLARGHPLTDALADLHREQGVERIALRGLAEGDIVEIMERAAGQKLDAARRGLARELLRESDGNPFYTAELLRHLTESGGIYQQEDGRWAVKGRLSELGLPESVREVVGRRVERLGEETRKALSVAAVIGRDFDVDLLLRVSGDADEALLGLLEEAVGASVLIESASVPGRFSFAHALINHTLYEDLGTTRRARLHLRIAEALEALLGSEPGARVSELAHHWAKATTAVDLRKAVTYARMAGERAVRELAPDEGLRWFNQALELQGQEADADRSERCELLIGLGEAQRQAGAPAYRERLLEASGLASELGDADRAARAALANNRGFFNTIGTIDRQRVAAIERAIELDEPSDPVRRARLLALQAQELIYEPDPAPRRALADQAISLARQAGEPRMLAEVLRGACNAYCSPDALAMRVGLAQETLASAAAAQDPALQFWAHWLDLYVQTESGQLERAHAALEQMELIAGELAQPTLSWVATGNAAGLAMLRGELVATERLAKQTLRLGQECGQLDALLMYGVCLPTVRLYQGRGEEMIAMIEQSAAAYHFMASHRATLAQHLSWLDRRPEAAAIVEDAAKDRFAHLPWDTTRTTALAHFADAAAAAGVTNAAAILYELMEPYGDQVVWNGPAAHGHIRLYLGLLAAALGRDELADQHFAFAGDFHETNGLPLWAARTHLGWADALASRGQTEPSREHAARALELSREHDYGLFEPRAAALIETQSATEA